MSHTVSVNVEFKDRDSLARTVEAMGGTVIGQGSHRLFSSSHTGYAVQLPSWQYPIIIDDNGICHYDNYNGAWGRQELFTQMQERYAVAAVQAECERLGWYNELNEHTGELVIHHPSGGTIHLERGGVLDAKNFSGVTCQTATEPLEAVLGKRVTSTNKPELNEVKISNQVLDE